MISSVIDMLRHARAGRVAAIALVAIVVLSVVGPSPIGSTGDAEREARAIPMSMPSVTAGLRPPATVALATPVAASTVATPVGTPGGAAIAACAVDHANVTETSPEDLVTSGRALVTVGALNLRAGPSTDCPIVGSLGFGMEVRLDPKAFTDGDRLWRKVSSPVGDGYTVAHTYQAPPSVPPTSVPVLMYHHIADGPDRYFVSEAVFEQQVSWLKAHGYVSITPRDLYNARYNGLELPARPIMFTIDDGDQTTMTFKDILDRYGFRGVYFLPNYAEQSDDEIRDLDRSGQVCGHTVDHPDLATLGYDAQYAEIVNNKSWLEGVLGHPVSCFAYPFGSYNADTNKVMTASGYSMGFNAWGGAAMVSGDADPLHILRYGVYGDYSWDTFLSVVRAEGGAPS